MEKSINVADVVDALFNAREALPADQREALTAFDQLAPEASMSLQMIVCTLCGVGVDPDMIHKAVDAAVACFPAVDEKMMKLANGDGP